MLLHPTHDSAKSSPNVHLSCPTKYCLYSCSQLVFFFTMRNLGPACTSRNFLLSRINNGRLHLFCLVVTNISQTTPVFFFFISFCTQLTPQPTTFSHFLCQWISSSLWESCLLLHDSTYKHVKQRSTSSRILRCVSAKNASSTLSGEVGSKSEFRNFVASPE